MLNSPKNSFTEILRMIFEQISGYCGLAKLTHKINHYSPYNTSLSPYLTDIYSIEAQSYRVNPKQGVSRNQ